MKLTASQAARFTEATVSAAQTVARVLREGDPDLVAQLTPQMLSATQQVEGRKLR